MRNLRITIAIVFLSIFGISASAAYGETATDVLIDVSETGIYSNETLEPEAVTSIEESIEAAAVQNIELGVVILESAEPSSGEFAFELIEDAQLNLLLLIEGDEIATFIGDDDPAASVELQPNLSCATEATEGATGIDIAVELFVAELLDECGTVIEVDEDLEDGKDRFGAEDLGFVVDEVADDEVYVGSTRTDIDEEALIRAVREVNTFTGLRLIVVAPDNPQPTASAFARRLQESTTAEVLLFPKGDRAVSSVTEDLTQPRSADINEKSRNQACATRAVWAQPDEAQAVAAFGDRLTNGCPFEPPVFLMAVLGGIALLAGLLALLTMKENETKTREQNANLPAPKPEDLIVAAPRRSEVKQRAEKSKST